MYTSNRPMVAKHSNVTSYREWLSYIKLHTLLVSGHMRSHNQLKTLYLYFKKTTRHQTSHGVDLPWMALVLKVTWLFDHMAKARPCNKLKVRPCDQLKRIYLHFHKLNLLTLRKRLKIPTLIWPITTCILSDRTIISSLFLWNYFKKLSSLCIQ